MVRTLTKKAAAKKNTAKRPAAASTTSAAGRIDQRIDGVDDWRGERLAEIRASPREKSPLWVDDLGLAKGQRVHLIVEPLTTAACR